MSFSRREFLTMSAVMAAGVYGGFLQPLEVRAESLAFSWVGEPGGSLHHLTDIHGTWFGSEHRTLLEKLEQLPSGPVFITGDLLDRRLGGRKAVVELGRQLARRGPVFAIEGNHDAALQELDVLGALEKVGVTPLRDSATRTVVAGAEVTIVGLADQGWSTVSDGFVRRQCQKAFRCVTGPTILLAHQPQYVHVYAEFGPDLILSGHTHGGQVRLPFLGGVFAPNQGFFPEYMAGSYRVGNSVMHISPGLGTSGSIPRTFNPPQWSHLSLYPSS